MIRFDTSQHVTHVRFKHSITEDSLQLPSGISIWHLLCSHCAFISYFTRAFRELIDFENIYFCIYGRQHQHCIKPFITPMCVILQAISAPHSGLKFSLEWNSCHWLKVDTNDALMGRGRWRALLLLLLSLMSQSRPLYRRDLT